MVLPWHFVKETSLRIQTITIFTMGGLWTGIYCSPNLLRFGFKLLCVSRCIFTESTQKCCSNKRYWKLGLYSHPLKTYRIVWIYPTPVFFSKLIKVQTVQYVNRSNKVKRLECATKILHIYWVYIGQVI